MIEKEAELVSPPAPFERPVHIVKALRHFHVVRNPWLRWFCSAYPLVVGLVVLADWLFLQRRSMLYNLPVLTSYLAVALGAALFVRLYDQVPETLRALWDRGLLQNTAREAVTAEEYARFITRFDRNLNGPWSWICGGALLLTARLILLGTTEISLATLLEVGLGSLSYFMDGVVLWKLVVVAVTVRRLSDQFTVSVQPTHPDRSGGLGPLGELCFANALILLGPTLYFTAWVVIASSANLFSGFPVLHDQILQFTGLLEAGVFHAALIGLILLELVVFLLPLYWVHREMVLQGSGFRQKLDALARQIDEINRELLESPQSMEPARASQRLETLKWLRQVYEDNKKIPAWPFNREVVLKFLTSQALPLLSLTGLGKPILEAIGALTNLFR